APLLLYEATGLQSLLRRIGLLDRLPPRLRAMETLLPPLPRGAGRPLPRRIQPHGPPRRRGGLLLGCVQRVFFRDVNAATARVLAAEGCEVVAPPEQGCCGALLVHAGEEATALAMARRTIDLWERLDVDTIVINAAGCGSTLK